MSSKREQLSDPMHEKIAPGLPTGVLTDADVPQAHRLSRETRLKVISRCSHALYRWYVDRSQKTRNWNPDTSFQWLSLRTDHNESLLKIIEGFYAVEQYAPDYTSELTRLARRGFGHSQFQIRWGAEEEKHADLWRNVLLFTRSRTQDQLEDYTNQLRDAAWTAPFDTPVEMLFYTVLQERATQLIYLNTGAVARGLRSIEGASDSTDPVLSSAIVAIAIDEAAHYAFFLALARLHCYYFPEESLHALVKVIRNFVMPASRVVPNYGEFTEVLFQSHLFGPHIYGREVAKPALAALGIDTIKAVEEGIARSRMAPAPDGTFSSSPNFGWNFKVIESSVRSLFDRVSRYESSVGLNQFQRNEFVPSSW